LSTLFAFLHHLAAFTLVAALAIEFALIGQIQIDDAAGRACRSRSPNVW
jgi:uncharacterized membrane protein